MCIRACVRVCVCVCVFACVRRFVGVCVSMCGTSLYRPKERPELSVALEFDPWNLIPGHLFTMFSTSLYDDIRTKEASQKRMRERERERESLLYVYVYVSRPVVRYKGVVSL